MTETVEMAQALTRIPSVNPYYDPSSAGEAAVAVWLEGWSRQHGFDFSTHEVFPGRSNAVIRLRNGADHPHLLLNGHIDTVGVQAMTIPPFGGEISGARLWGRGSADMKGPDACMLATALRLQREPASWRGTLTVGLVVDEEYRFSGIKALMEKIERPDFAVVGEPTSMDVVRGCKGVLRFTARATGRAAHSCDPGKGRSAILAMADAALQLDTFFQQRLSQITRPEFGSSTGSIGIIHGGTGVNIVPESCTIQVDIRLIPGQDWQTTYHEIQTCVRTQARRIDGIEWTFGEPDVIDPSFETPATDPLVQTALKVFGKQAPKVVAYGCDASKIAAKGVSTIICGPGQIDQAHTANESVALAELEEGTELYVKLAKTLLMA